MLGEISLHLFLTEYRVPYPTNHRGNRDIQAFFQEAAVSIHDGKALIGDIDILKTQGRSSNVLLRVSERCEHGVVEDRGRPSTIVGHWQTSKRNN